MSSRVLDSSAVLAYLHAEPGGDVVAKLLEGATISAVNVAEVTAKLEEEGVAEAEIGRIIRDLNLEIVPFDEVLAYRTGALSRAGRRIGLSLGDRACLATAQALGVRAVTADRRWSDLKAGVKVQVIR